MVSAKNVQDLNARIEKIHTEKTKVETQRDMLKKRLISELESYKTQFGVSLMGKTLAETRELISAEAKSVSEQVSKEYDLKEKVVSAIERGDYDMAYELLGIKTEVEEKPSGNSNIVHSATNESSMEEDETVAIENGTEELELSSDAVSGEELELEDDFDSMLLKDSSSSTEMSMEDDDDEDELELDDDDEDMDLFSSYSTHTKSTVGMQGVEATFGGMEEMVMEDTPDLDDEDFGFGDMLQGSKFSLD